MDSTVLIVTLSVLFVVIGVGSSVIYYFARYYVKTGEHDSELLTKKPLEIGTEVERVPSAETAATVGVVATPPPRRATLDEALAKTRESLWGRLARLSFQSELDANLRDEIEEILYTSDLGPKTAEQLLALVTEKLSGPQKKDPASVRAFLREQMLDVFTEAQSSAHDLFAKVANQNGPIIWMIVGVNGVGKTTTIGKLASLAQAQGLKTLIVAGDTFRAAADSQLKAWADRAGCEIFSPENVRDPSAVAYAGMEQARKTGAQLVIVDTAGRLHTQEHLMEELKKMRRVLGKLDLSAPHERLLVVDANAGQNALIQAQQFGQAVDLTGVIVTKMDGSSKAGVAVGIANELKIPIVYIGVGESVEDLRRFDPKTFVEAIV